MLSLAEQFLKSQASTTGTRSMTFTPNRLKLVPQSAIDRQLRRHAPSKYSKAKAFYIVNDEASNRYVVVSSDQRLQDILGYSEKGTVNPDSMPCGMVAMLESFNREYAYVLDHGITVKSKRAPRKIKAVSPLIKTDWGQDVEQIDGQYYWIFNTQCPEVENGYCVTGCVATAMAQIMNYYKYPERGQGTKSYTSENTEENLTYNLSLNFANKAFDWNNMLNTYKHDVTSQTQLDAVAYLMKACGYSVNMTYGFETGSGARSWDVPYAMKNYFKYNPNMVYYREDFYTSEEWEEIIQAELSAKRPILYSATDPDPENGGGHAFILDGCNSSGYYHFNWGWNGNDNGYFLLSALTPGESNYSESRAMVCKISPQTIGTHEDIFYTEKFVIEGWDKGFNIGQSATVTLPTYTICYASDANTYDTKFSGALAYLVFDENDNLIYYGGGMLECNSLNDDDGLYGGITLGNLSFSSDLFKDGLEYRILPVVLNSDLDLTAYTPMRTLKGETDYYVAKVSNGKVKLYLKGEGMNDDILVSSITLNSNKESLFIGGKKQLSATVQPANATNQSVTWKSSNTAVATVSSTGLVTAKKEGTATITCTASDGGGASATCVVTVTDPAPPIDFVSVTCDKTSLTQCESLVFHAKLKNRGDTRTIQTALVICDNNMNELYRSKTDSRSYRTNVEVSVDYSMDLENIPAGKYKATIMHYSQWLDDNLWRWTYGSASDVIDITVSACNNIQVTGVTLSSNSAKMSVGSTLQLNATVLPANATDKTLVWKSDNTKIAKVSDSGLVTAVGVGTTIVKATSSNGKSTSCTITVVEKPKKGDVNTDSAIDVADIATVIDVMAGSTDYAPALADVNSDGSVDVADIAAIIDIMAGGGGTEPGGDDTPHANVFVDVFDAEINFADQTEPQYIWATFVKGSTLGIQDGCLHYSSPGMPEGAQPLDTQFVLQGLDVKAEEGVTYTLELKIRGSQEGNFQSIGFVGQNRYGSPHVTTEWQVLQMEYIAVADPNGNIANTNPLIQCGNWTGEWWIEYIKITHKGINPDLQWENLLRNGGADAAWDNPNIKVGEEGYENICAWSKEWGYLMEDINEDAGNVAIPRAHPALIEKVEGNNVFVCHAKAVSPVLRYAHDVDLGWGQFEAGEEMPDNSWQNQFWINYPRPMKANEFVKISFRYKASKVVFVNTMENKVPGDYLGSGTVGDIKFGTDWQTFEKVIRTGEGAHSLLFNVTNDNWNRDIDFYFDDISVSLVVPN